MNTDKLFDQFATISKAGAYDILAEQVKELKAENEKLKEVARAYKDAIQAMYEAKGNGALMEITASDKALAVLSKYKHVNLGRSFEKLKEDMREDNDDLKDVNI